MRPPLFGLLSLGLLSATTGCVPDIATDESVVDEPRLLAVRATPAEVAPGEAAHYEALVADGAGVTPVALDWAYCTAPKPLAELGPVSRDCIDGLPEAVSALGQGLTVNGRVPIDACRLFGPDPPPSTDGQAGRPTDPNLTGGYSQPLHVALPESLETGSHDALFEQRILCGLAGATQAESAEYRTRYRRNENPAFEALELVRADGSREVVASGEEVEVRAGEAFDLVVRWPACPTEPICGDGVCLGDERAQDCAADCAPAPKGCGGAEDYLFFDRDAHAFETRHEAMRVAWTATVPGFATARTGVGEDDEARESENRFVTPEGGSSFTVFVSLRDDRGGASWQVIPFRAVP